MVLIAESHRGCRGSIAGYAVMRIHSWNRSGYLLELAAGAQFKRHGVGRALLEGIKKAGSQKGLRAVIIETQPGNSEANEFYEAMGLRICGYNDRYYTNTPQNAGETALFYSMDIP